MMKYLKLKLSNYLYSDTYLITFGIFTIVPFIIISLFNHPAADDFCFYNKCRDMGFWNSQTDYYIMWTGRYFSTFLLSVYPLSSKFFFIYKLVPIGLIISLVISLYHLMRLLFERLEKNGVYLLTFYVIIIYFFQMPTTSQGFYWLSGSLTYMLANILTILLFYYVIKMMRLAKIKHLLIAIFLSFTLIGLNETSMLIVTFLLGIILIYNSINVKKVNYLLLILVIFTVIFSIIVIVAPGNIGRGSHFPDRHKLIFSTVQSILEIQKYLSKWLPLTIVFTILLFDSLNKHTQASVNSIFDVKPIFALMLFVIILFISFFPGYWSMGICSPDRTINVVYFFYVLSFLYLILVIFYHLKRKNINFISISSGVKYLLICIVIINLYQKNNIRTAYADLINGNAYKYDSELRERYKFIGNTNHDTCIVPELKNKPYTIFVCDITFDASDWLNDSYNTFWKKKIVLKVDKLEYKKTN